MQQIIDLISQPWPWYVAGVMIALVMAAMLFFGESFGFSSNLRTICSMGGAGKVSSFFNFNWKGQMWNIMFLTGTVLGGYLSGHFLNADVRPDISQNTIDDLQEIGISSGTTLNPEQLFGADALSDPWNLMILLTGGFLVGFGSRYAGGCTSGHAISGLSDLQMPSLIAVVGFFIGGLTMTHFLLPLIF
jgi:uncharacterized membrane protein YedE/YeeE